MLVSANSKRIAAVAAVTLLIAACAKKDSAVADTSAAPNTMAAGDTAAPAAAPAAPAGLSDANIVAILDAANMSDSTWGSIAATKGTSSQVRDFGKMMSRDHHALRKAGQDLAKKLGVTPQPPADDNSQADLQKNVSMLNNTAKGKDFDKAYIDHEVDYHKQLLETAVKAMAAAQSTELKNLIQKAAPNVQAHLDKAQSLQKGMK